MVRVAALALLLLGSLLSPSAQAICPRDWAQCKPVGMSMSVTLLVNPVGVVFLDIPNATVTPTRQLLALPGHTGHVRVELLEPGNGTANVTIDVGTAPGITWTSANTSRTVQFTGFHNETFGFAVALGLGNATINLPVNVTSGGEVANMTFAFQVASAAPGGGPGGGGPGGSGTTGSGSGASGARATADVTAVVLVALLAVVALAVAVRSTLRP